MEGTDAAADTSRNAVVSSGTSPGPTHLVVLGKWCPYESPLRLFQGSLSHL